MLCCSRFKEVYFVYIVLNINFHPDCGTEPSAVPECVAGIKQRVNVVCLGLCEVSNSHSCITLLKSLMVLLFPRLACVKVANHGAQTFYSGTASTYHVLTRQASSSPVDPTLEK